VFVNLDRDAVPVHGYFGPVLDIIAGSGVNLDTLELYERGDWQSHSNWKTMLENYLECYHCAVAHPSFSAAIDVRQEKYNLTAHGWFLNQIGQVRPSALEGRSRVKIYEVTGQVAQSQYHMLWPNTTISINPGFPNLSVDVWNPDGPNATKSFSEQYFVPGISAEFAQELIAFNKEVGAEDDLLTDSVQRGLLGGLPERGRFLTNSEHLVIYFQKLIVNAVTGAPAALVPADAATAPVVSRTIPLLPDASVVPDSERNP
jgi:phenylpropionate dioxygenase-like ring-hydroxylating dioxygenase large terminal subunit